MRRTTAMIAFLLLVCLSAWAQTSAPATGQQPAVRKLPIEGYAGTWNCMFEGKPWLMIGLGFEGDNLVGWMQHAKDYKFNDQGEIKSIGETQAKATITKAEMSGDGLLLTVKDDDTQKTEHYVMRLISPNTAELKMSEMTMPPGMPKPRPWKLTKSEAAQ